MNQKSSGKWNFAVDRGGTFTDIVGVDPKGNYHTYKILSQSPQYNDASTEGIRRILGLDPEQVLSNDNIDSIRFGTTVATNALLERKGGKTALIISKGFRDLLDIGYQARPEIFDLAIDKMKPLYSKSFEVYERIKSTGKLLTEINKQEIISISKKIKEENFEAVAVVFLHSWKNPENELLCESILREQGIENIFLSHKTVNLIKAVSRGQSTVIDAYLSPAIAAYLKGIQQEINCIPIEFIQSSGGLTHPEDFRGKDAILSGPAGGVIAVGSIADDFGLKGTIGFDMGGTSTDVSRYDGKYEKIYYQNINGIELQKESLNIVTVASGGGSILWFDGQKMRSGPHSAGALPGPACYGFGGPLTITDANLLTGRIVPEYFPETFGPDRNSPLDELAIVDKFKELTEEINSKTGDNLNPQDVALGFIRIANEKMALAIKEISVSKGFDVRDYALVCFGGAGGQHACQLASLLDINKIIFHPLSGVMSAYGIGMANPVSKQVATLLRPFDEGNHKGLIEDFKSIENDLCKNKFDCDTDYKINREIDLRPIGSDSFLTVSYFEYNETKNIFKEKYKQVFGFVLDDTPLEIVNIRVSLESEGKLFNGFREEVEIPKELSASSVHKVYYPEGLKDSPVYLREEIPYGSRIHGPAIIVDKYSTLVVDPGYIGIVDENGTIILEKTVQAEKLKEVDLSKPDPILLEVFSNLFMSIATEMGFTLRNTSHSVNIKERLDFSCAVFQANGDLVANAPHIPVHLGSMTDTVKAILDEFRDDIKDGDVYVSNNPYKGGSHLPDVTVVCPVFTEDNKLAFFIAARGHHADIGGTTPGSLPPESKHIEDEGVLIDYELIVRDGELLEDKVMNMLSNHKYPVRNIKERMFDLKAQIAACHKGESELIGLLKSYGLKVTEKYMEFIQDNAEFSVKIALQKFLEISDPFEGNFTDYLDDGTPIAVNFFISGGSNSPETIKAIIDFTGSGPQHDKDNLNTPLSVTRSAILYTLRALTDVDIPLNSGCMKPIEVIVPERSILNPEFPAPVASGNVETSQRIVDVILGSLDIVAASQGTMNNFLFQVEGDTPYYETIAGGSGAMQDHSGVSAVQVHMTNTRITDPEVMEVRHPDVFVEEFNIRENSGGDGKFSGGDGVVRKVKFLKPANISIISERRNRNPYGIKGGQPGEKGINLLKKADGTIIELGHRVQLDLDPDDTIIIKTPGGGGFGSPES